jgi:hypothetical protein
MKKKMQEHLMMTVQGRKRRIRRTNLLLNLSAPTRRDKHLKRRMIIYLLMKLMSLEHHSRMMKKMPWIVYQKLKKD